MLTVKKRNFYNRLQISFLLFFFYASLLLSSFFATNNNNFLIQVIFSCLFVLLLFLVYFWGLKEIFWLVFPTTLGFVITLLSVFFYWLPQLVFLCLLFLQARFLVVFPLFFVLLITFLYTPFLYFSWNIIIKKKRCDSLQNSIFIPFLCLIWSLAFFALVWVGLKIGFFAFLFLLLSVLLVDILCYVFGFFWGKKPISSISPNKTWFGTLGGVVMTVFVLFGYYLLLFYFASDILFKQIIFITLPSAALWIYLLVFSSACTWLAFFGDLFFSYIKRKFQIKDFSNLLQSHGGVLDRFDALSIVVLGYFIYGLFVNLVTMSIT